MPITITQTRQINIEDKHNVIFVKYSEGEHNDGVAARIADNTAQTWQQNRGRQETLNNTIQGKTAEELFHQYMLQNSPEIHLLSYDEIRNDNYTKHAPFDFLAWNEDCDIDAIVRSVQRDIARSDRYVRISQETRALCRDENVKILEVKSTKITDRHKKQCKFNVSRNSDLPKVNALAEVILDDDYLTYPLFCRKTTKDDYSVNDYIELLRSRSIRVWDEAGMRRFETSAQLADAFVRVYVDEAANVGFVVGWIDKRRFYDNAVIKKMPQRGKSELALYFAASLRTGCDIDDFSDLFNI